MRPELKPVVDSRWKELHQDMAVHEMKGSEHPLQEGLQSEVSRGPSDSQGSGQQGHLDFAFLLFSIWVSGSSIFPFHPAPNRCKNSKLQKG